jgi:hypothetical protein
MLRRTTTATIALAALVTVACGTEDSSDQAATDERIAALEQELAQAERRADDLADENAELEAELEAELSAERADDRADDRADGDGATDPDEAPHEPAASPQPMRSAEGLNEQLRLLFDPGDLPEGYEPGSTDWRALDPPGGLDDTYSSPGELAIALAAELDAEALGQDLWETTARVLLDQSDPEQAYVAVLSYGMADDAVAGRDVRMTVTRSDDGWEPGGAEERFHCLRGVDADLCV